MSSEHVKAIVERCEEVQRTSAYDENEYVLSEFERLMPIILELLSIAEERGKALEKIADYSTLDGQKYNSYEDGWHGVADFSRQSLDSTTKRLEQLGLGEGKEL